MLLALEISNECSRPEARQRVTAFNLKAAKEVYIRSEETPVEAQQDAPYRTFAEFSLEMLST